MTTTLLEGLFPPVVLADEASEEDFAGTLFPEEVESVRSATQARRREVTGARACARRLLRRLGVEAVAIPSGPDRSPIWPEGVCGSISHTADRCVVAVARQGEVTMLGLDIEVMLNLDRDLWSQVCTPDEIAWLSAQPEEEQQWLATLLFSAKECGYKAQYPLTRIFVDFLEGHVDVHRGPGREGTFDITFPDAVARELPVGRPSGRWAVRDGLVITAIATARLDELER